MAMCTRERLQFDEYGVCLYIITGPNEIALVCTLINTQYIDTYIQELFVIWWWRNLNTALSITTFYSTPVLFKVRATAGLLVLFILSALPLEIGVYISMVHHSVPYVCISSHSVSNFS